jgi:hypothetical protein
MSGPETIAFTVFVVTAGVTITRVATVFFRRGAVRDDTRRDAEMEQRLARIEHAVDAIAVEVERVSEGQRFTTKVLAERMHQADAALPTAGRSYDAR